MEESIRRLAWNQVPYEARVAINGPTTTIYSLSNIPGNSDPGWGNWINGDGNTYRLINIHGPFAIQGHEGSNRCEDGWLGVDKDGNLFCVESEYVRPSPTSSEFEERARPIGFREATT